MICDNVRHDRERTFTLHSVDQARTDFAIEAIYARLAPPPTRVELARTALMGMMGGAGLVILWFGVLWRHGL
jgi:hypothetical protein